MEEIKNNYQKTHFSGLSYRFILVNSGLLFFAALLGYSLDLLVNISLSRLLSPRDYGDFTVAISWAMFWSIFASLGGNKAIVKFLPQYFNKENKSLGIGILQYYIIITLVIGLLIAFTALIAAYFNVFSLRKATTSGFHPILLSLFMLPLIGILRITSAVYTTRKLFLWAQMPERVLLFGIFLTFIWVEYFFGVKHSDWMAVTLMLTSYFILCLINIFGITKFAKIDFVSKHVNYSTNQWLKVSVPIMVSGLVFYSLKQIDLTMIELMAKTEKVVGFFGAASKVSEFIYPFTAAISAIIIPFLSEAIHDGNKNLDNVYKIYSRSIILVSSAILLITIVFGKELLSLFQAKYIIAYPVLVMLTLSTFFVSLSTPATYLLQYGKHANLVLIFTIVSVILDVLLNYLLIPPFGMNGAALATAISVGVASLINLFLVWKYYRLLPL